MNTVRVLIVENEPYMAEAIRDGLRLEAIAAGIAVLDRGVPGPSGDEIAERVVASGSGMPILMLAAADKPPGSDSASTTTPPSRSSCENSRSGSERSTAGARTTGRPCGRSQVCGWIRSAARSTETGATSRSPGNSSPRPKAASSAPKIPGAGVG
jgi:hypothetical protein